MNWNKLVISAKNVYKELGSGFSESIYQKAMGIELQKQHILHSMEDVFQIKYKGVPVGFCRSDIIVYDENKKFLIELKAIASEPGVPEFVQVRNYLKNLELSEGLLINFPIPSKSSKELPTNIHAFKINVENPIVDNLNN